MKPRLIRKITLPLLTGVALFAFSGVASSADKPGTVEHFLKSREAAEQVKKGTTVAMACSKCQTVLTDEVDKDKSFLAWFLPDKEHACPGCGGKMKFAGPPGKGKMKYVHTCSMCGDESVFCCSTIPGRPTEGMKKKGN